VEASNQHFLEYFEGISERGIYHGVVNFRENNLLKIKDKKS